MRKGVWVGKIEAESLLGRTNHVSGLKCKQETGEVLHLKYSFLLWCLAHRKVIRITWKVLNCGVGERGGSVGPIV
jgi:hypothetical protein